jgi:hypothetical protein
MVSLKQSDTIKNRIKDLRILGIVLRFECAVVIVGTRQVFPFL